MTASKSGVAMSQFCEFVNNDVKKNSVEFHDFDKASIDLMSSTFKIRALQNN